MSKRKKNYPDPNEVVNKYGADALRYVQYSILFTTMYIYSNKYILYFYYSTRTWNMQCLYDMALSLMIIFSIKYSVFFYKIYIMLEQYFQFKMC